MALLILLVAGFVIPFVVIAIGGLVVAYDNYKADQYSFSDVYSQMQREIAHKKAVRLTNEQTTKRTTAKEWLAVYRKNCELVGA